LDRNTDCNGLCHCKNNMEYNDKVKRERIQLATMIGVYLAIILLLVAIIVLVKNVQEIKTDPIMYGMEKNDFVICSCYHMNGDSYDYDATGLIVKKSGGWNVEFLE